MYINDLTNACNSDIILHADDSVLLCVEQSIEKLKIKAEASFRKIGCWINCNRLTTNYKKQTVFCSYIKNIKSTINSALIPVARPSVQLKL